MPKRYRRRSRKKRKRTWKRRRITRKRSYRVKRRRSSRKKNSRNRTTIYRTIVPPILFVKLRYYEHFYLQLVGAAFADTQFALNNCDDPNTTGAGHQPRGWDNWVGIFLEYRVHAAKFRITGQLSSSTATQSPLIMSSAVVDSSTGFTSLSSQIETGDAPNGCLMLHYKQIGAAQLAGQATTYKRSSYVNIRKALRVNNLTQTAQLNPVNLYQSTTAATPVTIPLFVTIAYGTADAANVTTNMMCSILLEYYVEFRSPGFFNQS